MAPGLGPVPATPGLAAPVGLAAPPKTGAAGALVPPAPSGLAAASAASGTVLLLLVFDQPATMFLALGALVGLAVNPAGPVMGGGFVAGTELVAGPGLAGNGSALVGAAPARLVAAGSEGAAVVGGVVEAAVMTGGLGKVAALAGRLLVSMNILRWAGVMSNRLLRVAASIVLGGGKAGICGIAAGLGSAGWASQSSGRRLTMAFIIICWLVISGVARWWAREFS